MLHSRPAAAAKRVLPLSPTVPVARSRFGGGKTTPSEPPLERPMSADEARGFGPDGNGGVEGQPYTPTSEDQIT
jgi:hypothetical protein